MNPEGPAHPEEAGLEATACPHAVMCVGSAGLDKKHSLLNPTAPLLHHCPPYAASKKGMEHNRHILSKRYVQVQKSGWKTSAPPTVELQQPSAQSDEDSAVCFVNTAAFSSFFQSN